MISLDKGSDTRIFTSNVIKWAKSNSKDETNPFDNEIFETINRINEEIIETFVQKDFDKFSLELKEKNFELRKQIQKLSKLCNVEIEPEITSDLLDNLMNLEKSLFCIIPGGN